MRLCLIANPNSIHTVRWVRYFAQLGHDVHLLGDKPLDGPAPEGAKLHDLSQVTNVHKLRYVAWGQVVRRLVREIRPDVLHAHQVASAGWLGAAAGYHPFLVTSWGSDLLLGAQRSRAQRQLARWVLRQADYVTCVSQRLAEAAQALGANPQRLEVVPWGVDTQVFHPAEEAGLAGSAPIVLSIRAMRPVYNPLDVARAVPLVLDQVPAARFVIRTYNADPALLARFRSLVEAAGVAQAVEYVGDLPDDAAIADLYRRAAVAVSVPSSDGTPQSVLEAMACGAVPVLSDLPWLREWVQDGRETLVVPVGDATAIANAVVRLLSEGALRRDLQQAGFELIRQRADNEVCMQRSEEIYHQLAESERRDARGR